MCTYFEVVSYCKYLFLNNNYLLFASLIEAILKTHTGAFITSTEAHSQPFSCIVHHYYNATTTQWHHIYNYDKLIEDKINLSKKGKKREVKLNHVFHLAIHISQIDEWRDQLKDTNAIIDHEWMLKIMITWIIF